MAMVEPLLRLYIVRHGLSIANAAGILQGQQVHLPRIRLNLLMIQNVVRNLT